MEKIKKLFQDTHGRFDYSKLVLHGDRSAIIISILVLFLK